MDLNSTEQAVKVYHEEPYRNRRRSFPSHNLYFGLHSLPKPWFSKTKMEFIKYDPAPSRCTGECMDTAIREFQLDGGKWFLKSALYYENNSVVGCHNCHNSNITQLGFTYAYRKALNSTLKFITGSKHKPYIFIRTTTPDHFENGEWNTGGYCNCHAPGPGLVDTGVALKFSFENNKPQKYRNSEFSINQSFHS